MLRSNGIRLQVFDSHMLQNEFAFAFNLPIFTRDIFKFF
jgi:hypothetical protein